MDPLAALPEVLFEVADLLNLKAATEAGLAELPSSELEALRLVTLFPGCGVAFLTGRTRLRQANISATVRSLVERGLVVKQPDERDKRAVRLYASAKADEDLKALRQVWLHRLAEAFGAAGITAEDGEKVLAVLEKLRTRL